MTGPAPARGAGAPGRLAGTAKGAAGLALAVALWEMARRTGLVDSRDLPAFPSILREVVRGLAGGDLLPALLQTIGSWLAGLAVASAVGVAAGIALALMPGLEATVRPVLEFVRPIPSVALIPVALMVLGLNPTMQIGLVAFASVWPILFSTKAGVEGTDPRLIEAGRVFGLGRAERLRRIVCPSILPAVATGMRTAAAIALVVAVTVEMLTGRPGLGLYLQAARLNGRIVDVWSAILVAALLGYLVNAAFLRLERRLIPWSPEHRAA